MCGFFGHGFYYIENNTYVVVADWEVNSHARIKEQHDIPNRSMRWGFNPINGEAVSNESVPLTDEVKTKIGLLFDMYFPNPQAIARWMKNNYAKNNDALEWDNKLSSMLDSAEHYFSSKFFTDQAKDFTDLAKDFTDQAKDCTDGAKDCTERAKYFTDRAKDCTDQAKDYTDQAKDCTDQAKDCTGAHDILHLYNFIEYFLAHPNEFWKNRNIVSEVEYQPFVKI